MSYSNDEIEEALKRVPTLSQMSKLYEDRGRDRTGKLTKWKTGRRYMYIAVPPEPLPKTIKIGKFNAFLTHSEQYRDRVCRKCLRPGHAHYMSAPSPCDAAHAKKMVIDLERRSAA